MTVLRVKKKEGNFLIIDKTCLNDRRLSFNSRGLHAFLMGFKDDTPIKLEQLRNYTPQGRDALRTMLNELKEAGYITVERIQDIKTGRYKGIEYTIHELPIITREQEQEEEPLSKNEQCSLKPRIEEAPKSPLSDFPTMAPQSGNPTEANPTEENQGDNNINIINNKYYKNITAAEGELKESQNAEAEKNAAAVFSEKAKRAGEGSDKPPTQIPNRLTPEDALIHETLTDNQIKRIERLVEALETEVFMDAPKSLCAEIQYALLSKSQFTACGKDFGKKLNAIRKVILRGDWQRPAGLVLEEDQKMQASVEPIEAELREAMGAAAHFKKMHAVSTNAQSRTQFEKIIKESEAKVNILKQKLQKSLYEQKLRQCG